MSSKSAFREIVEVVVIALALTFVLKYFVVEVREIPSGSMIPTIKLDERVLVDKIFYKLTGDKATKGIKRQEIIVFEPPAKAFEPGEQKADFIKRVIGLPGDTVEVKPLDGVYVNGQKLDEPYVNEIARDGLDPDIYGTKGAVKVPPNSLFMMGDNRNNSKDSRKWGFASIDKVKGRAFLRFWPLTRLAILK